ncbi:MAG: LarC family nickel insertion protein [Acidobacteria bacterium]|nr:LarC family nickel insertion protein [Acidobacteriota bacterium]
MLVGALADAGADQGRLAAALDSLGTGAAVSFERVTRRGIAATKFHVAGVEQKKHRHLSAILKMIEGAALSSRAKQNAAAVFQKLGEAEAAVHRMPVEKVHFHEVGAADSIADIVGTCVGFDLLGVDEIVCAPVNVGSGTVETEHGLLPVPAPATAALLAGKPVYARGPAVELTTPTGAAVVATLAAGFGALPALQPVEMKKGRPGVLLRVLAKPEDREALAQLIFAETSTLGLRMYPAERRVQPRHWVEVLTPHGKVRIKVSGAGGYAPEYEDCRRLARETGVALKQIMAEANFAYLKNST